MLGKFLSFPVRLVNVIPRTVEKIVASMGGESDIPTGRRIISAPLEKLAEAIEEIDEGGR